MITTGHRGTDSSFTQQGKRTGWLLWLCCCLLALCHFAGKAGASTFTPMQTTFSLTPVGATSAPAEITLIASAAGMADAPLAVTEGTSAAATAEFAIADTGTCGASANLSPGQSCTVFATFSPRFPGLRRGAVQLRTPGGALLASTLISGQGQGGLPVLLPGQINTVAGNGQWYFQRDGIPATSAPIYLPTGVAVDGAGNLFLADSVNNRVRRVDAVTQVISTVAGNGTAGAGGDGGPATLASITGPTAIALDGAGNLYIADTGNEVIRRVDAVSGVITTVAGTPGTASYTGDEGPATAATLSGPQGIAVTPQGDLIVADTANHVIRLVSASDQHIHTIAGTGAPGFNGDGIPATSARLYSPAGVATRADGTIAVADLENNRVRLFLPGGTISTVAGNGTLGYTGDDGPAAGAELQGPAAVAFTPAGDLLVADSSNNCVRLVYGNPATITTLTGTPSDDRYAGDGGPANEARMHGPNGIFFDARGNLWIADHFNNRIRVINGSLLTIGPYPTMKVGKTSQPVPERLFNAGNGSLTLQSPVLQQATLDAHTTSCGTGAMSSSALCSMGVEFAPTNVGPSINGSITWNSDAPNVTPIDQLYGEVLSVEPTSVLLSSASNPGLLGQQIVLTATVTSADAHRSGTVDFVEGGTTWCSDVPLGADGTAACAVPSLSLGTHTFTANYSGDNNNAASQSPAFQEVIKQQAALALTVTASPATITSPVRLSFSAADSTGTPSGSVSFFDGTTLLTTLSLDAAGNAEWTSTSFGLGTHTLSAQYSGDSSNVPGTSAARVLQVVRAATTTSLSVQSQNVTVGASVQLTAHVASASGPTPTGQIAFMDGSTLLGNATLDNAGSATFNVSTLAPGSHPLTAVYAGDGDDDGSSSAQVAEQVDAIATSVTVGADVDPLHAGGTVHLSAIVSIASGATPDGALTGSVRFMEGATELGRSPINSSGQASLALTNLAVGDHHIQATFEGSTNYAISTSSAFTEVVQQTPTTASLNTDATSLLATRTVTFTLGVASTTGTPTGSVTFRNGSTVLGTGTLDAHGGASFTTDRLAVGVHNISASYEGDANYLTSTSPPVQVTVQLATPTLSLAAPAAVVNAGIAVQFTATLASPGAAPFGTVSLLDGAVIVGTQPIHGAGSVTFSLSTLGVGSHELKAAYSGDSNNAAVASTPAFLLIQQAPTVTALVADANPLTQGQPLLLKATVTSEGPGLTGDVTFADEGRVLGSAAVQASGLATLGAQDLGLGLHHITATYGGDTNHAPSASAAYAELVVQASTLRLSSSTNPSISGHTVRFSGQLSGSPLPTGTLAFRDNGLLLATVPLNEAGAATLDINTLSVGAHVISADYSGDTHFASLTAQLSQTITAASTTVLLTSESDTGTYGQPLSLAVSVSSNGSTPTGTVSILEGAATLGSATLNAEGRGFLELAGLAPGPHTLSAVYAGDGRADASRSAPLQILVKQVVQLTLRSNPNPALTLSAIELTATITTAGAAPAGGAVTFTDGGAPIGTAAVDVAGHAILRLPRLAAGHHALACSYPGDLNNFPGVSATVDQLVQLRATATTVSGAATDVSNPQKVTLIAVVHGDGDQPPGGTVSFTNGTVILGVAPVDTAGVATITVLFQKGTEPVTAAYAGDEAYAASHSEATPITPGKAAQFTLTVSASSLTLVSHQHTTVSVTLASVKNFTDTIHLGCLGLPFAATCTFDHPQVKLNADGTATASLLVDTGNPLGAGSATQARTQATAGSTLLCCSPLALLLGTLLSRRRRRRVPALFLLVLCAAVASGALTGCGGLRMSGTPPGTYSFKVVGTGQGSNTTQVQDVTLVVTQ